VDENRLAEGDKTWYTLGMSPIRRTRPAVFDLKYHIVWVPKYRKLVLKEALAKRLKEVFQEIAERYEFEIDTMEVKEDHVHLFLTAPPRYSPSEIVQIMKSISAKVVFREFPEVEKQLWGGELWNDGYFVRSVGDKVTSDIIRRYIKYQHQEQLGFDF
jgi:putative transposase